MTGMAYDERLAERIRACLAGRHDVVEKKMFGGLTFMVGAHMACGVMKDQLVLKVGDELYASVVARPHARPMDFTGKPMRGMVYVAPAGYKNPATLRALVDLAVGHAEAQPAKKAKRR
jgi:TfoX/Sxy family transcriptional regulator of competence genes